MPTPAIMTRSGLFIMLEPVCPSLGHCGRKDPAFCIAECIPPKSLDSEKQVASIDEWERSL
jgi:hypothetical protein